MLDYSVRLKRLYGLNVTQVVIFLQETDDEIAFTEEYVDETTTHRYRVIRMWEQDADLFLNHPPLLPLAPLTSTNKPQVLLSQVAENLAKIADRETKQDLSAYTEILAGLKFEKDLIRQFLREDIMQESVIYQDILQKGERIGQKIGEERLIIRQITRRFGNLESVLIERIKLLSTEELEELGEALLDFTDVSDLVVWLNQENHQL